jgi:hypothetical protein
MKKTNQDWLNDYSEFLNSEPTAIPSELTTKVFTKIKKLLYPSVVAVFAKIFGIHAITGFFSLAVCNQFGLNPFKMSHSLSDVFMDIGGHGFCMVACGTLFISLSIFLAGFFLTIEETKALRRTEFLQTLVLGLISLGLFMAVGAEVALTFGGLWILGGLIGGFAATEILWQLKKAY